MREEDVILVLLRRVQKLAKTTTKTADLSRDKRENLVRQNRDSKSEAQTDLSLSLSQFEQSCNVSTLSLYLRIFKKKFKSIGFEY